MTTLSTALPLNDSGNIRRFTTLIRAVAWIVWAEIGALRAHGLLADQRIADLAVQLAVEKGEARRMAGLGRRKMHLEPQMLGRLRGFWERGTGGRPARCQTAQPGATGVDMTAVDLQRDPANDRSDRVVAEGDLLAVNAIRTLTIDAVQKAEPGHAGLPMGMAAVDYTLWTALGRR